MSFRRTMAENVAELLAWHDRKHLSAEWTSCPHEPCDVLDPDFRRLWGSK